MKINQEMPQGENPNQGCCSYNIVCREHDTQLGLVFVEPIPRRLQGGIGYGYIISLFMATHPDSLSRMEGVRVFILFH
jgi:hypothetical protein